MLCWSVVHWSNCIIQGHTGSAQANCSESFVEQDITKAAFVIHIFVFYSFLSLFLCTEDLGSAPNLGRQEP